VSGAVNSLRQAAHNEHAAAREFPRQSPGNGGSRMRRVATTHHGHPRLSQNREAPAHKQKHRSIGNSLQWCRKVCVPTPHDAVARCGPVSQRP